MITHEGRTYFTEKELGCKHCGLIRLAPGFPEHLLKLRLEFEAAMVPTSACRCKEHNDRPARQGGAGGHERSLHVGDKPHHPTQGCCAIDIAWRSWPREKKLRFARLAWAHGWSVGLHDGFCHIDRRADFGLTKLSFLYGAWSGKFSTNDVSRP